MEFLQSNHETASAGYEGFQGIKPFPDQTLDSENFIKSMKNTSTLTSNSTNEIGCT